MSTSNADPVLVVGAGPTGLLATLLLARQGVPVRLVDAAAGPGRTSRAMGVQARTLEFYRMIGLADEAVGLGIPTRTVRVRRRGRPSGGFSLGEMGRGVSPFPYMLALAQDVHERMLIGALERMGVRVERGTALVGLDQDEAGVTATLRGPDGATRAVRASHLVGADGAGSATRKALGVGFGGGTTAGLFYVADAAVEAEPEGDLTVGFGPDTFTLLMPVRTSGMKRLIGVVPPEIAHRDDLTFEDLRDRAEGLLGVRVRTVNWFSTYRVHHRVADRFRVGRVFLAGDACHIHSPVGGQGMNTGLGDAMNLAWKLADVLQGRADASILESYHAERHAFAKGLVETTDAAFQKIVARSALGRFVRAQVAPRVAPALAGLGAAKRAIFRTISQTRIAYPGSPLSEGRAGGLRGGDRLPWTAGADTHAPLDGRTWQVHVHGDAPDGLAAEADRLGLAVHRFAWGAEMRAAGLARDAAHLVRPDGHVALAGATAATLRAYAARHGLRFAHAALPAAA